MATYGLDISQILGWTFPQLLLLNRRRKQRERNERRFQLMLTAGTMPPRMFDQLWQSLGGEAIDLESIESTEPVESAAAPTKIGRQSHNVDSKGNVIARVAPLLSDIALGKATAPPLIPVTIIEARKSEENEELDG